LFADWRHRIGGHISVYAVRQVFHQRAIGHQLVHRSRVYFNRGGHFAVTSVIFGMRWSRQRSQVHASDGMKNSWYN